VQSKHEKARRLALGAAVLDINTTLPATSSSVPAAAPERPGMPRRGTSAKDTPRPPSRTGGVLSPLNPRARTQGGLLASALTAQGQASGTRPKRGLSLSRK